MTATMSYKTLNDNLLAERVGSDTSDNPLSKCYPVILVPCPLVIPSRFAATLLGTVRPSLRRRNQDTLEPLGSPGAAINLEPLSRGSRRSHSSKTLARAPGVHQQHKEAIMSGYRSQNSCTGARGAPPITPAFFKASWIVFGPNQADGDRPVGSLLTPRKCAV